MNNDSKRYTYSTLSLFMITLELWLFYGIYHEYFSKQKTNTANIRLPNLNYKLDNFYDKRIGYSILNSNSDNPNYNIDHVLVFLNTMVCSAGLSEAVDYINSLKENSTGRTEYIFIVLKFPAQTINYVEKFIKTRNLIKYANTFIVESNLVKSEELKKGFQIWVYKQGYPDKTVLRLKFSNNSVTSQKFKLNQINY